MFISLIKTLKRAPIKTPIKTPIFFKTLNYLFQEFLSIDKSPLDAIKTKMIFEFQITSQYKNYFCRVLSHFNPTQNFFCLSKKNSKFH